MTNEEIHYDIVSKHLDFTDKHVLEIGCGRGGLTRYMGRVSSAKYINAIEYDLDFWGMKTSSGLNWDISQGDARNLKFADNLFDCVISIGVFEHINGLDEALNELERVLKPGGECFALFEPIYTSIIGHHYNFWVPEDLYLIPPWGHLFMSQDEMYEHIKSIRDEEVAQKAAKWIYEDQIINRYTRKDYYHILASSGMTNTHISEMFCTNREFRPDNEFFSLSPEQQENLLGRYSKDDLSVRGFEVILQKNRYW